MPKLHLRCIAGLELAFSLWKSKAQAINAQKQPYDTAEKKMAYAKTAPIVHCLAFSMAGPIGEHGASDKRTKTATIETRRKFEKIGLCQNCTNGALQAWSLLFSVAGPMEEQDTSDKRTKPAMLCHSCAGDMLYVIAKHTYTFGTSLVLQCSSRAHQRKPKTCQNMFRSCQCHAKSLFKQNKGSRFTKTQFATQITQESQEDQGQPKKGVNFHTRSKHFFVEQSAVGAAVAGSRRRSTHFFAKLIGLPVPLWTPGLESLGASCNGLQIQAA